MMPVDFYDDTLLLLSKETALKKRLQEQEEAKAKMR